MTSNPDDRLGDMSSPGANGGGGGKRQGASKYHKTMQSDGTCLTLRHAFGVEGGIRDNVAFVTVTDPDADAGGLAFGYLVHPVGQQVALHRIDDGSMKFLTGRQKNVREVLALSVSPNKRVIAVCERGRALDEDSGNAQVSVYHVANCKRIRTMSFPGRGDFVSCCFSGDNRWLSTACRDLDNNIVVWNWDKEKVDRTAPNHGFTVNRVAFNPGDHNFLTTSGPMHLRLWYAASDNILKAYAILPQAREQDNFADHSWIGRSAGQPTRMVAITDGEGGAGATASHGQRGPSVLVFDTIEGPPYLEIKQTLHVPLPLTSRLETLIPFGKGFVVAGGGINGYLGVYENMDDVRDPYMLIKSFSAKGAVLAGLTLNRNSETLYAYSKSNELLTFNVGNMDVLDEGVNHFQTLLQGGNHTAPVASMDACLTKPIVVTVGEDRVLRVWNYLKWKCDVVYDFRNEDPNCVSLHPMGFQVAVGFKDRIRIYSVLMESLRLLRDIAQKNCRAIGYAHGGHLLAAACGFSVVVYSSITAQQLHSFTGHIAAITLVRWGPRDNVLFSTGQDGNVYGWDLQSGARVDDCVGLNRSQGYHAMAMGASDKREAGLMTTFWLVEQLRRVVDVLAVCGTDAVIREMVWAGGSSKENVVRDVRIDAGKQDEGVFITCMETSVTARSLFCGTNTGRVRVYEWPLPQQSPAACIELPVHAGPVTDLVATPDDNFLFTCGEDGSVFVLAIKLMERGVKVKGSDETDPRAFDTDAVLVSQEEIEEQFGQVSELNKAINDIKSEHAFALHRKTTELMEELKQASEENAEQLAAKNAKYEDLHQKHETMKRENAEELDKKDRHHVQVMQEVENQYEHRLAVELDRYDRLSEEVESVQQRCESLLESQQKEQDWELRARDQAARRTEKELRTQIERLQEEKSYNDQMYKEVLDQQEAEYESELQQLAASAESELHAERTNTGKLRATLQARKTKEDQLRKKMQETQRNSSAREMMFAFEKAKREKLEATMHHFEQHMHQRELTLAEKEKTIVELRSSNTTLDNFRFVLDHRLQQLVEERGPITSHIEGLEAHIRGMYDELVSEFGEKKEVARVLEQKELKVVGLTQEVNGLRSLIRSKDRTIFAFKRELSSMVHLGLSKDLEQAVKDAYKKFVQEEDIAGKPPRGRNAARSGVNYRKGHKIGGGVNGGKDNKGSGIGGGNKSGSKPGTEQLSSPTGACEEGTKSGAGDTDGDSDGSCESGGLPRGQGGSKGKTTGGDTANHLMAQTLEAHRQREFMEKKQLELRGKLADAKLVASKQQRAKLDENSALISECNSLRKENVGLKRKNERLRLEAKDMVARLQQQQQQQQQQQRERWKHPPFVPTASHPANSPAVTAAPLTGDIVGIQKQVAGGGKPEEEAGIGEGGEGEVEKELEEQTAEVLSQQSRTIGGDSASITVVPEPETGSVADFVSAPPAWTSSPVPATVRAPTATNTERLHLATGTSRQSSGAGAIFGDSAAVVGSGRGLKRQRQKPSVVGGDRITTSGDRSSSSTNGRIGGFSASSPRAGTGAGRALVTSTGPRVMKGGTRDLFVQASLTGATLRLERALDEKERELQLQRAEIHGLRERLRISEMDKRQAAISNNHKVTIRFTPDDRSTPSPLSLLGQPWCSGRGGTAPFPNFDGRGPSTPETLSFDPTSTKSDSGNQRRGGHFGDGGTASAPPPGAHSAISHLSQAHRGRAALAVAASPELFVSAAGNQ